MQQKLVLPSYGVELKSFTNLSDYKKALKQAAQYGKQLKLNEIALVFFIESIDEENRQKLEVQFFDPDTAVQVQPIFIETGK